MARLLSLVLSWLVVTQRGVDAVRAGVVLSGQDDTVHRLGNPAVGLLAEKVDKAVDKLSLKVVDSAHHHVPGDLAGNPPDDGQLFIEPEDLIPAQDLATDAVKYVFKSNTGTPLGFESDGTPIGQWKALGILLDLDDDIFNGELTDDTAANSALQLADQVVHHSLDGKLMTTQELVQHIVHEMFEKAHMFSDEDLAKLSSDFHEVEKKMQGHMHGISSMWNAVRAEIVIDDDIHAVATALSSDTGKASDEVRSEIEEIKNEVVEVDEKGYKVSIEKAEKAAEKAEAEANEKAAEANEKAAEANEKASEADEKASEADEKASEADEKGR